jgi:hypothetical protein
MFDRESDVRSGAASLLDALPGAIPTETLHQFLRVILEIPLLLFQAPLITKSDINIAFNLRNLPG